MPPIRRQLILDVLPLRHHSISHRTSDLVTISSLAFAAFVSLPVRVLGFLQFALGLCFREGATRVDYLFVESVNSVEHGQALFLSSFVSHRLLSAKL